MPYTPVYTGSFPGDGTGDGARVAFTKINLGFKDVYEILDIKAHINHTHPFKSIAGIAIDEATLKSGDTISYDSGSNSWRNVPLVTVTYLDDLSDIEFSKLAEDGDQLYYRVDAQGVGRWTNERPQIIPQINFGDLHDGDKLVYHAETGTWVNVRTDMVTQIIDPRDGDTVIFDGDTGTWRNVRPVYDVAAFYPGVPTPNAVLLRYVFSRKVSFPAGLAGSVGGSSTASTALSTFSIRKNGTEVGTASFPAGSGIVNFAMTALTQFLRGDVLEIVAPAIPDATANNISITLAGYR